MKKIKFLILALLAFASSYASAADEPDIYRFGVSASWMNYLEPGLISIYGLMFGADGLIQLNFNSGFDLRFEGDAYYGNVQYDGSIRDTQTQAITPLRAGSYDYMFIVRAKPEVRVFSAGADEIFANAGLGLRYLNDRVNSTSGYQREISYAFLPVGFRIEDNRFTNTLLGFDFEYDIFLAGQVKSHLSDTGSSYPDVTNHQSTGWGLRALLEYRFLWGSRSIGIKPYYQWWNVGTSDSQPYITGQILKEPQNSTSMGGIILDYGF